MTAEASTAPRHRLAITYRPPASLRPDPATRAPIRNDRLSSQLSLECIAYARWPVWTAGSSKNHTFGDPHQVGETIYLRRFPQPYGGYRWYFICPSSNRRCSVLLKPPGGRRFRSRRGFRCRLQYQSQRLAPQHRYQHGRPRRYLEKGHLNGGRNTWIGISHRSRNGCAGRPIIGWMKRRWPTNKRPILNCCGP